MKPKKKSKVSAKAKKPSKVPKKLKNSDLLTLSWVPREASALEEDNRKLRNEVGRLIQIIGEVLEKNEELERLLSMYEKGKSKRVNEGRP